LAWLHNLIWKTPSGLMNPAWAEALAQYRYSRRGVRPQPEAIEARLASERHAAA
jgi:hypothetical protein